MAAAMGTTTPGTTPTLTLSNGEFHAIQQFRLEAIGNGNRQAVLACDVLMLAGRANWTRDQIISYLGIEQPVFDNAIEVWQAGGLDNLRNVGSGSGSGRSGR